ncbi:ribonuclease HII [Batrachochytrium salamandrivorans]|nr:ribonuclease HII [Batrachochytrium salamandrivorans]
MKRFHTKLLPGGDEAELKQSGIVVGVDEAGRGPVLGPMVYGAAYWSTMPDPSRCEAKFDDSKKLTEATREALYEFISSPQVPIGYVTCELTAQLLSEQMLQTPIPVSLNKIAWDCTVELVQRIAKLGYPIRELYVDTVGKEDTYAKFLQDYFPDTKVTVKSKADSLFKVVSCASICAKVERDLLLRTWDNHNGETDWGSGYPGDERTKQWLNGNSNKVFGFPSVVRFSWQTTKTLLDDPNIGAKVEFPSETGGNTMRLSDMFHTSNKRLCCRGLKFTTSLDELLGG